MNEQELESLRTVIHYLWRDEQRHFEDIETAAGDPGDHIFRHLETLDRYVTDEQAADVPPFYLTHNTERNPTHDQSK